MGYLKTMLKERGGRGEREKKQSKSVECRTIELGYGMVLAMIGLLFEAQFSDRGPVLIPLNVAPALISGTSQGLRNYLLTFISGPW